MTIEDALRDALAERLDAVEVPPGDVHQVLREGERRRPRTAWKISVAAASLAAIATGVVAVTQVGDLDGDSQPSNPTTAASDWQRLPDPPLSPRAYSLMVWTGEEVLVIGGEIDNVCPPTADCAKPATIARDGAAYDPATRSWRKIAPAPEPLESWMPHAVVGDTLVVADDDRFLSYDATDDVWRELPQPADGVRLKLDDGRGLSAHDGKIYALDRSGTVWVLDPVDGSWSSLPESAHRPRIDGGLVVGTPEGVVVIGQDSSAPHDGSVPNYLLAEVYRDGTWIRLERSDIVGGYGGWHWTGERLIAPHGECVDGGEVNGYGRCIPTGGALDPGTGAWQALPMAPNGADELWSLNADGGGAMATSYGHLYDDSDGSWTAIGKPDGAASDAASAVFGEGTLFAFGGVEWGAGLEGTLSKGLWAWTP